MLDKFAPIYFFKRNVVLIFAVLSVFIFNGNTGCGSSHLKNVFAKPEAADFSDLGWLEAYNSLSILMQRQYAFGDWKNIDWTALNQLIRPKIELAESTSDAEGYAAALLEFTRAIPDGHVTWGDQMQAVIAPNIEGSYGFAIAELDNGKTIATTVTPGGPAAVAGMIAGDVILEWNGLPVSAVAEKASILWRPNPASVATTEHKRYEQFRSLTLVPVGTQTRVKFSRPDGSSKTSRTLTARNDGQTIQKLTEFWNTVNEDDPIQYSILSNGYGYILLGALESDDISFDELFDEFKMAMVEFTAANVPGIIIDLRANGGGSDELAAKISGFFYPRKTFYEFQNIYNAHTAQREIILPSQDDSYIVGWGLGLYITPQEPQYSGPIVALINPDCVSSGEGVAMTIQNLTNGYVLGLYGTNGSFGMTGGKATMPLGFQISFPTGQSLDVHKVVQLDSKDGIGGITPDVRVPRTSENMIKYVQGDDVELDYAIDFLRSM
jgi:carboxyl-terminal processing protease